MFLHINMAYRKKKKNIKFDINMLSICINNNNKNQIRLMYKNLFIFNKANKNRKKKK